MKMFSWASENKIPEHPENSINADNFVVKNTSFPKLIRFLKIIVIPIRTHF